MRISGNIALILYSLAQLLKQTPEFSNISEKFMSIEQQTTPSTGKEFHPSGTQRRRKRRNWIIVGLLLLAVGGGYYWYQDGEKVQADKPLIATAEIGSIQNTIASAGKLKPSSLVDVGAQVSGQLQKLHVEVGDMVEEGQLLAEIDARVQENRVAGSRSSIEALEAQIAAREAALELAMANFDRQERLMAEDASSQLDYDTAVNNLASAKSSLIQLEKQIQQSRSSLASDETQLEYSKIYAPAAGTVVSIEMNEGRTLNASQQAPTILRIADLSTMTVETQISEADIGNVKNGMSVYFTTLGGGKRRWHSTLRQILPTPLVENNVVLYTGLFDVDNKDGSLFSEMTAQVYFITSSAENVLTVPVGALTFTDTPDAEGAPASDDMAARMAARRAAGGRGAPGGNFPKGIGGGEGSWTGLPGGVVIAGRVPYGRLRSATVKIVNTNGSQTERQVVIGVTSRTAAEVISGLAEGDKVVAGIIQATPDEGQSSTGIRPPRVFGHF
jgi:macrolide-specific efflux system membrane fusion protein